MKQLVFALCVFGAVGFGALAGSPASAYGPDDPEQLIVDPDEGLPRFDLDATVTGCFPGEPVVFAVADSTPFVGGTATCDPVTLQASITLQAPAAQATYELTATMQPFVTENPDVPDRETELVLSSDIVVTTDPGADPELESVILTGGVGDGESWLGLGISSSITRMFLGLLALLLGIFFVILWRRRRDEEEMEERQVQVGALLGPPGPHSTPLA